MQKAVRLVAGLLALSSVAIGSDYEVLSIDAPPDTVRQLNTWTPVVTVHAAEGNQDTGAVSVQLHIGPSYVEQANVMLGPGQYQVITFAPPWLADSAGTFLVECALFAQDSNPVNDTMSKVVTVLARPLDFEVQGISVTPSVVHLGREVTFMSAVHALEYNPALETVGVRLQVGSYDQTVAAPLAPGQYTTLTFSWPADTVGTITANCVLLVQDSVPFNDTALAVVTVLPPPDFEVVSIEAPPDTVRQLITWTPAVMLRAAESNLGPEIINVRLSIGSEYLDSVSAVLNPGVYQLVTFPTPWPAGFVGTFEARCSLITPDGNPANDTAGKVVTVLAPLRDYAVVGITTSPPVVYLGETLYTSVTVHSLEFNPGPEEVTVRLQVGSSYDETASMLLYPGQHYTFNLPPWLTDTVGVLEARCMVLAQDSVSSNDTLSGWVTVFPQPDFDVVSIEQPPDTVRQFNTWMPVVMLHASEQNNGPQAVTARFRIGVGYDCYANVELYPGQTMPVTFAAWVADMPGAVVARCSLVTPDGNQANDTQDKEVTVLAALKDFAVVGMSMTPPELHAGEQLCVSLAIHAMEFNTTPETVVVRLQIGANYDETVNVQVAPGEYATLTYPPWLADAEGIVEILSTLLVEDSVEFNDTLSRQLTVVPAPVTVALVSPGNNAPGQPTDGYLTWRSVEGATGYDVWLDVADPPATQVAFSQFDTFFHYTKPENARYYWKVIAHKANGFSTSAVWDFGTWTKLTPELASIIQHAPPDTLFTVIATTTLQADLSTFQADSTLPPDSVYEEKKAYLKQVSQEAQAGLLAFLNSEPSVDSVESFWLASRAAFVAPPAVILAVAARGDVGHVTDNFVVTLPDVTEAESNGDPEWNIQQVKADLCWAAGVDGTGVVVGTIDTGVDADHPAFHGRWRTTDGWFDGVNGQNSPSDDYGHGTHVMGIICGGDGNGSSPTDIGVAPGATFIAAKGFDNTGHGEYVWILPCLEWMADRGKPDVLNNSWGSPDRMSTDYWAEIKNLRQLVGTVVVLAIGNNGDEEETSMSPGSFPTVIGTGASGEGDYVLEISSRGPAPNLEPWNVADNWPRPDWNLNNPAVVAPGDAIRSAFPGGGYRYLSGTSHAAPHVAGCVALMRQKYPSLAPDYAFNVITDCADQPVQGDYPNNTWGWGRLNCLAAVSAIPTQVATSRVWDATYPPQAKHIVRDLRTKKLHVVYHSATNEVCLATSTDGGHKWDNELVAQGTDPCISLDHAGSPWIVYRRGQELFCSIRSTSGTWSEKRIFWSPGIVGLGPPSFVCSNWLGDAVPYPKPTDMGYVAVCTYYGSLDRVVFVPFDTINCQNEMYNYAVMELALTDPGKVSMPCISRTPGDYIHVTWKAIGDGPPLTDWVAYTTTTDATDPAAIRSSQFPVFSDVHPVRQGGFDYLSPVNDAYSLFVNGIWQVDYQVTGYIQERNRYILDPPDQWSIAKPWSDGQTVAGDPALSRNAGVWCQELDNEYRNIVGRLQGDDVPTRLTLASVNQMYPHVDVQLASTQGGFDTLWVIWTERPSAGKYAVCFASFPHLNADRDWFYNIVCGQEDPSPFCIYRDGAITLDAFSVDYADSALFYRLSYLNPLYGYRIHATVYHQDSGSVSEEFVFPVDSTTSATGAVVTVEPNAPADVWFDVPPELYQDGATDLVVSKLAGEHAVVAGVEVHEFELPVEAGQGSGGQSAGSPSGLRPPAILAAVPNPFSRAISVKYQFSGAGKVSLRVLDVTGRCVRRVPPGAAGRATPGIFTARWDGLDDRGRTLPGGIYFCQLEANGARTTAKVCLTR